MRVLAFVFVVLGLTASVRAQPRVAVVDTDRVFSSTGVAVWREAVARLEAEQKTFVAVESPNGSSRQKIDLSHVPEEQRKKLEKAFRESDQRAAWSEHERSVLDPIRTAVMARLVSYAKAQRIDLLLDRVPLPDGILYASAAVDITDAFIKSEAKGTAKK